MMPLPGLQIYLQPRVTLTFDLLSFHALARGPPMPTDAVAN